MTDELPTLLATSAHSQFRVRVHALAWSVDYGIDYPGVLLLSATGPDTAAKALRAILCVPEITAEFRFDQDHYDRRLTKPLYDGKPVSYTTAMARLAPGAIHLVALAKVPGLIPNTSDEHLWAELSGPRYTTPLLRSWMPWIRQRMIDEGGIVAAQGYQSKAGVLTTEPAQLDELVSLGVRRGFLPMKD